MYNIIVDCYMFLDITDAINFSYLFDLVLMSETMEGLRDGFLKWKEAFESKDLKVNHGKTKVMVSSGITKDGMSKSMYTNVRSAALE